MKKESNHTRKKKSLLNRLQRFVCMACTMLLLVPALSLVFGTMQVHAISSGDFGAGGNNLHWEYDDTTKTLTISGTGAMQDWSSGLDTPWGNSIGVNNYNTAIETIIIGNGVTNIGENAFGNYYNLTDVQIADSVTSIGWAAFNDADNLTSINLPSNLKTIGNTAFNSSGLTKITIPDTVETIGSHAFSNCGNLIDVDLGNGVKTIGREAFLNAKIKDIKIPESVTSLHLSAFSDCGDLTKIIYEGTYDQWNALMGGGSLNTTNSLTITFQKLNVKASPTELNFGSVQEGYSPIGKQTVSVTNDYTTSTKVNMSEVSLSGNAFELEYRYKGNPTNSTASHELDTSNGPLDIIARPKDGLPAGNYNETVTVICRGANTIVLTIPLKFTVTASPSAPSSGGCPNGHASFGWVTIASADEHNDGVMVFRCSSCGHELYRALISGYGVFNKNTAEKIRTAAQGATVSVSTKRWISFNKEVMEALAARPDVTLTVSFLDGGYRGNRFAFTIPAGTDVKALWNEEGYAGFRFLGGSLGTLIRG